LGHARRVADAASYRSESKNEGLAHCLLRDLGFNFLSPGGLTSPVPPPIIKRL
jgi:hypothetical protein